MAKGKWDYDFLDFRFNNEEPDAAYRHELDKAEPKPVVFIQGLHRSGTTFLLSSLSDLYHAASTSVYHIAFYRRLLHAEKLGEARRYKQEIADYLARHGLTDRQIDAVPVSPESLDEYGFIYDRLFLRRTTTWVLREICAKLSYLHSSAPFILLKDPVYFPCFVLLRAAVARAKFIFIHREPRRVLHSWFRANETRLKFHTREPFMALLRGEKPRLLPTLSSYVVRENKRQIAARCAAHIRSQITDYLRELPFLPPECYIDVRYEDLLDDTEATLGKIVEFIGIEPAESLGVVRPRPRPASPLPAVLVRPAENLSKALSQMGYPA